MSDSENEQMSGEGTPPASENEAPQDKTPPATPRPQQRSPASRAGKVLPMSPAWIKQKSTPKTKVRTAGYDCDTIASHAEIVLLSVPAGVKLDDLHGKQLTLPDQAGATSSIKGYRYEAIRGPDQSHKDLHLLTSMDGVANCKPVSAVYSLQRQLADVPADEEPVDENLLVSIREALPAGHKDRTDGPLLSNKKRKSKHGRSSRLTGNAHEHDGPQQSQPDQTAADASPPATDGNAAAAGQPDGKKATKAGRKRNSEDAHGAAETGADEDAGEDSDSRKKLKKKKKKKRREEGAEELAAVPKDEPDDELKDELLDVAATHTAEKVQAAGEAADQMQEDVKEEEVQADAVGAAPAGVAMEEAADAAEEPGHQDADASKPKKKRKRAKSTGDALGQEEGEEAAEGQKKRKKKSRAASMGALEVEEPVAKKKKKGKRRSGDSVE